MAGLIMKDGEAGTLARSYAGDKAGSAMG